MSTTTELTRPPVRPSDPDPHGSWRQAREIARALMGRRHRLLKLMWLRRTIVGSAAMVLGTAAVFGSLIGLGSPTVGEPIDALIWGLLLTARTAAAVLGVYVTVRAARWLRAPWRMRTRLRDALSDAAYLVDERFAQRMSSTFDSPDRWWSDADANAAEESLDTIEFEIERALMTAR